MDSLNNEGAVSLLLGNLADFLYFAFLGGVGGFAFPLALRTKRRWHFARLRFGRQIPAPVRWWAVISLVLSVTAPWLALALGRWYDAGPIATVHALVLIASSAVTIAVLLRRWRLVEADS